MISSTGVAIAGVTTNSSERFQRGGHGGTRGGLKEEKSGGKTKTK